MNTDLLMKQLVEILETPSPSGDTEKAVLLVKRYFEEMGIMTRITNKGGLIATMQGKDNSKHRVVSAHIDTLGAMVKEIKSNGRVKLTQIGGYPWNAVEGEYCQIVASNGSLQTGTILTNKASAHVHGIKSPENKRDSNTMEVRIDAQVSSEQDVRDLGLEVGDFVYLDPRTKVTETGYVKSRHLDDKASVACLLGAVRTIIEKEQDLTYTTHFFISNYEEVGHGANYAITPETFEFIAVDMAAPGEGQMSHEHKVTICAKDSSGPYDLKLRKKLEQLAKDENIDYVVDVYPYYRSDASAMLSAGYDICHGLIGPGVDASHSFERTHIDGLKATIELTVAYLINK